MIEVLKSFNVEEWIEKVREKECCRKIFIHELNKNMKKKKRKQKNKKEKKTKKKLGGRTVQISLVQDVPSKKKMSAGATQVGREPTP